MKYLGIILILLSSLLVSREYRRYMQKRLDECLGFCNFIAHMKIQVGCYLRPVRELARGFSSAALSRTGFLSSVEKCDSLGKAFSECEPSLSLSEEERGELRAFFSSFGDGYLEQGVQAIETAHTNMERLMAALSEQKDKNIRLVSTLSVTLALGVAILVI